MNKFIRNLSINRKLLLILIFSSITSLLYASVILVVLEISEFQKNTLDDLSTLAQIVGSRSTAALMFEDLDLANENLAVFNNVQSVQVACLYDAKGVVFAELQKQNPKVWACPVSTKSEISRFEQTHLCIAKPIFLLGCEIINQMSRY